jgi:hypothetical protein
MPENARKMPERQNTTHLKQKNHAVRGFFVLNN